MGQDCTYPARDGLGIEAYLARPPGAGPFPAVTVLHARNGLLPFFKECADNLAGDGFVGFSIGWQTRVPPNEERRMPADRDVMSDIAAGIDFLRTQPFVDTQRLGVMGFCAGGTATLLAVSTLEAFTSAVPHYGAPRRMRESNGPAAGQLPTAFDLAVNVRASILMIAGEQDTAIPLQDVYDYRDRLESLGKSIEVATYPGMGHAFTIRGGRSYDEAAATDAWKRTIAHFKRTLSGQTRPGRGRPRVEQSPSPAR